MAKKRHQRTAARRAALALLYASELTAQEASLIMEEGRALDEAGPLSAYAQRLVEGVEAHKEEIDEKLAQASENWSVGRMPVVDRSILRLGTYELLFVDEVPDSVCINEAVALAQDFGGEDNSYRFINGILGRIARDEEGAAQDGKSAAEAGESPDEDSCLTTSATESV